MLKRLFSRGKTTTSNASNDRISNNGSFEDRMIWFVIAFVREFEVRLCYYDLILQGEIEKAQALSKSYTKEIMGYLGQAGGVVGGIAFSVLSTSTPISAADAISATAKGHGVGQSVKNIGEWVGEKGNAWRHEKKREKYANILWDIIKLHNGDRANLREVLISAALDIFSSFEFQFVKVNNNDKWMQGIIELARDGVRRSINYYVMNYDTTDVTHEDMIFKGAIYGKSKEKPSYAKTDLIYQDESGQVNWTNPSLYGNTGIAREENGSYSYYERKEKKKAQIYGYRRLLSKECWTEIEEEYELPQKSNNRFRNYQYLFQVLNDDERKNILSKIDSDYNNVTKGNLKEIIQEVKESILNDINQSIKLQVADRDSEVIKILQQTANNIDKIPESYLEQKFDEIKEQNSSILQKLETVEKKVDEINLAASSKKSLAVEKGILFIDQAPVHLFIGREKELDDLHNIIQSDQERTMVVILGLGGVGKTQLALRYIEKFGKSTYENIVWIDSESKSHLDDSFQKLAEKIYSKKEKIHSKEEKIKYLNQVYEKLSEKDTLIIFDNAEKNKYFTTFLPHGIYPANKKMHVLITSQNREWGVNFKLFPLSKFSLDDGIQLVKKGLNITDTSEDKNINDLLDKLQNLPLCIMQAISYIDDRKNETKYTIGDYLLEFDKIPRNLLDSKLFRDLANDPYKKTTFRTWMLTTNKIGSNQESGKLALRIFYTLSYLAPQNLKKSMFLILAENEKPKVEKVIRLLAKYSMINTGESDNGAGKPELPEFSPSDEEKRDEIFQIHRTVQYVTRLHIKEKNMEDEVIGDTLKVLEDFMRLVETKVIDYYKMREALPHFEAFLNEIKCKVQIEKPAKKDMEMYNNVVKFLTIGYRDLGNATILKDLLEEELAIKQKYYGDNHREVAKISTNLGNAYGSLGDAEKKKELLEKALAINENHYGHDHPFVAAALTSLGNVYLSLGDVEKGNELLERANEKKKLR